MTGHGTPILDCGWAGAALEGGVSGDVHVVAAFPGGVLVGVLDGLGHGFEAAEASNRAAQILRSFAGESLVTLFERCHEALHQTRGAVMSLASIDGCGSMTWVGVGNVEGVLLRADPAADPGRQTIVLGGGIVGYQLPGLHPTTLSLATGDILIMATDGIHAGFWDPLQLQSTPQDIADSILARHARGSDDALVLVTRYQGTGA